MAIKKKSDPAGYQHRCHEFTQCPLCYGCRNYNPSRMKCVKLCGENKKKNVCNTTKHKADLIAKMVERVKIIL